MQQVFVLEWGQSVEVQCGFEEHFGGVVLLDGPSDSEGESGK